MPCRKKRGRAASGRAAQANVALRPRGRPRSPEADESIIRATLELLSERGLHSLSMTAVSQRAGISKASLYRRHSSRGELAKAALEAIRSRESAPDTGSLRGDLTSFVRRERSAAKKIPGLERLAARMVSDTTDDPELHALTRETVVTSDRGQIEEMIRRGIERGELRDDIDLEVAIDLLHGTLVYRFLLFEGAKTISDSYVVRLLETVEAGIIVSAKPTRPKARGKQRRSN